MKLIVTLDREPEIPSEYPPDHDRMIDGVVYAPRGLPWWWAVYDDKGYEMGGGYVHSRSAAVRFIVGAIWHERTNIVCFFLADIIEPVPDKLEKLARRIRKRTAWLNGWGRR